MCIYIYICIEREREREIKYAGQGTLLPGGVLILPHDAVIWLEIR